MSHEQRGSTAAVGPMIDKAAIARVDRMDEEALARVEPIVRGGPATDGALAGGAGLAAGAVLALHSK